MRTFFAFIAAVAAAGATAFAADTSSLAPPHLGTGDTFGSSVQADGGTIVVGAPLHDHSASDDGAAFVLARMGVLTPMQAELRPLDPESGAHFGTAAAVSRDTVAVGAPDASGGGAVYVFERARGVWSQSARLVGASTGDRLGASVAIAGNTIVAGAPGRRTSEGAVFVFVRNGTDWTQQAEITGAQGAFGTSVGIRGERIAVGAPLASSSRGVAAVYKRSGTTWTLEASIDPPDGADGDEAGGAIALGDTWLAVGAAKSEVGAANDAGAIHVFRHDDGAWVHATRLVAPAPEQGALFGSALALDGGAMVVGSPRLDAGGTDAGGVDVFGAGGSGWTWVGSITAPGAAADDLHGSAVTLSEGCVVSGAPGRAGGAAFAQWATQEHEVVAADGAPGDLCGWSVAISGDTALVGAPSDHDTGMDAGSVYVFSRSAGVWTEQQKLTSPDVAANGHFGWSVALDGDTALVGAPFDDDGSAEGRAYVFTRTGTVWTQRQRLAASDAAPDDRFGWSVALCGDRAILGAPFSGVDGGSSGAAYVFARAGGTWTETQRITASDAAASDYFGIAVALDADTAIVGADYDDLMGSAYVFVISDGEWTEQQKLVDENRRQHGYFGHSVAIVGDKALVGAPGDGMSGHWAGKACVFTRSGGSWTLVQTLAASDTAPDDRFGDSVALRSDTALVGAPAAGSVGSAYLFVRSGGAWVQRQQFTPSDGMPGDSHGSCVALSQDTVLAGAPYDDDGGADAGSATFWRVETRPWGKGPKLLASDGGDFDRFGWSVAVSGDTAIVGTNQDLGAAGSAYVFLRTAGVWKEQQVLAASDAQAGDAFGIAVALSGDTALVGAPNHDDGASDAGSVYVFVRSAGVWTQQQELTASVAAAQRRFGRAVALEGDTAFVGTEDFASQGSAYVFARSAGVWTEEQVLTGATGGNGDLFGRSVAVSGDTALIGAVGDVDNGDFSGSAYVFVRSGAAWTEEAKLAASDAARTQYFGYSVALDGDRALVGAPGDSVGADFSGAAFVFERTGTGWTQRRKLTADAPRMFGLVGISVALHGDTALVGAPFDDDKGAAYVFLRTAPGWVQLPKFTAFDGALSDEFGHSVALAGDVALVGAPRNDQKGTDAGAVYVFDFPDPRPSPFIATPADLPAAWTIGMPLSAAGSASGGTAPCAWSVTAGGLPGGISLDVRSGSLSGAPDMAGAFTFTIEAADAWGATSSSSDAITINPAPAVAAATLPAWTVTRPCSSPVQYGGGTTPIAFDVASGDLPPGMTLTSGGSLEGVPTTPGTYTFGARVTDAAGATATGAISVTINVVPDITTTALPAWTQDRPYQQILGSSGGTQPLAWSVASGALPVGSPIDATTGAIVGTALDAGDYTFVAEVTDAAGATASRTFTVTVNPAPALSSDALPAGALGRPYHAGPVRTGGTAPFAWAVSPGTIPGGLTLDAGTGRLDGTPGAAGDTTLEFRVTDAAGATVSASYPFTVVPLCDLGKGTAKDKFVVGAGEGGKDLVHYVELLGGTELHMKLAIRTRTGSSAELLLLDGREQPLDLSAYTKTDKRSVTVKDFPVPATGRYFVVVRPQAGFEGTLKLTVLASADKTWKGGGALDPSGSPIAFDFCALPGSKLVVTTRATRKSAALPTIASFTDDAGTDLLVPHELHETGAGAVLRPYALLQGGDYHLTFASRDESAGGVEWTVRLRSPKGYVFGLPELAVGDD